MDLSPSPAYAKVCAIYRIVSYRRFEISYGIAIAVYRRNRIWYRIVSYRRHVLAKSPRIVSRPIAISPGIVSSSIVSFRCKPNSINFSIKYTSTGNGPSNGPACHGKAKARPLWSPDPAMTIRPSSNIIPYRQVCVLSGIAIAKYRRPHLSYRIVSCRAVGPRYRRVSLSSAVAAPAYRIVSHRWRA